MKTPKRKSEPPKDAGSKDADECNVVHHHHVVLIPVHRHVMHQKGQVTFGL